MDTQTDDKKRGVYEIGYLIATSIPEEKVSSEAEELKAIVTKAGASVIAVGDPHLEPLSYEMRKKTVSGAYEKYKSAYFGWIKFEVASSDVEGIKKAFEITPSILRVLLVSTVAENTYLGKRASVVAQAIGGKKSEGTDSQEEKTEDDTKESAPATIEEMDKSIDEMVKEV